MTTILSNYSREELERKLLHMTEFLAQSLAQEWLSRVEALNMIVRTHEAELENEKRIKEQIVCIFPAWDMIKNTMPAYYDSMDEWVRKNHELIIERPCICEGCKKEVIN